MSSFETAAAEKQAHAKSHEEQEQVCFVGNFYKSYFMKLLFVPRANKDQ